MADEDDVIPLNVMGDSVSARHRYSYTPACAPADLFRAKSSDTSTASFIQDYDKPTVAQIIEINRIIRCLLIGLVIISILTLIGLGFCCVAFAKLDWNLSAVNNRAMLYGSAMGQLMDLGQVRSADSTKSVPFVSHDTQSTFSSESKNSKTTPSFQNPQQRFQRREFFNGISEKILTLENIAAAARLSVSSPNFMPNAAAVSENTPGNQQTIASIDLENLSKLLKLIDPENKLTLKEKKILLNMAVMGTKAQLIMNQGLRLSTFMLNIVDSLPTHRNDLTNFTLSILSSTESLLHKAHKMLNTTFSLANTSQKTMITAHALLNRGNHTLSFVNEIIHNISLMLDELEHGRQDITIRLKQE